MEAKEAIKYLQQLYPFGGHCWLDKQRTEAIGMAIQALQEKPVSEDLKEAIDTYLATYFGGEKEKQEYPFLKKMAIHFAQWQKEQLITNTADAEFDNTNAKRMFIKALERVEEQNAKGYKLTDCDKNSWWEDFKNYTSCTIEQKPTLSEEDLYKIEDALFGTYAVDYATRLLNKIKSLRPQRWKPSDEQMKALDEVLNFAANHESPHWNDYIFGTLNNLIRQLKKLREE